MAAGKNQILLKFMRVAKIYVLLASLVLGGCASTQANYNDPLEPINRGVYQFNDALDKAIVKPVARAYSAVAPDPVITMVRNFFSNLDDAVVTINDLLQFKFSQAASDGTRFAINSTFGVFGLFNVASRLEKHKEDFGQTLGYWGVGSGPYLVLPFFGSSNFRDGIGLYADSQLGLIQEVEHIPTRNQVYTARAVSARADLLEQEKVMDEAAVDRYSFIRDAYLQRRKNLVYDGDPPREKFEEEDIEDEHEEVPAETSDSDPGQQDAVAAALAAAK